MSQYFKLCTAINFIFTILIGSFVLNIQDDLRKIESTILDNNNYADTKEPVNVSTIDRGDDKIYTESPMDLKEITNNTNYTKHSELTSNDNKISSSELSEERIDFRKIENSDLSFYTDRITSRADLVKSIHKYSKLNHEELSPESHLLAANMYSELAYQSGTSQARAYALKAEEIRKFVIESEPYNWQAQYDLAFSYSLYPMFLNKVPDAINQYEKLRTLQQTLPKEDRFSNTYVQLSLLYKRQGNLTKSMEVLNSGLEQFEDSDDLKKLYITMVQE
ncbi:hypothetical protein FKQ62_15130 [Vibrio sp. B1-2]|uniref:tetratricopeptide repeat protein n=1 Tax=Vibrio sp. B1-2 TaxID=2591465 RepID=UPI001483716B|nr:hypothetical protein [Vibrio sp. B1-2]NNO00743.1 hypothetical protein [Vibrio sp. B1-2]